jgi:hypothetical protein
LDDEDICTVAADLWKCGKVERFTAKLFQAAVEIRIKKMSPKATDSSRISIGAAFPQARLNFFSFFLCNEFSLAEKPDWVMLRIGHPTAFNG